MTARVSRVARTAWLGLRTPPGAAVALAVAFIGLSVWWLLVDTAPPDNDATKHLNYAITYFQQMRDGDVLAAFTSFDPNYAYPPLVHFIAAVVMWIGGEISVAGPLIVINVLFVPLLGGGCYLAARSYGRIAGVGAVLFALGTPMIISQFHSFMLDAPLAALVAGSVGAMVMSDRFSRRGWTVAAGVLMGLGMLVKSSFVVFVIGFVAVVIFRGGWRQWRNILLTAGLVAAVSVPWHLAHYGELESHTSGITSGGTPPIWYADVPFAERWSFENFTWYAWSAVNNQLYLPLLLLAVVGAGWCIWRLVRKLRAGSLDAGDYTPELLVGGLFSYVAISWLPIDDPRYTLPMVVYLAVVGTAWLGSVRQRAQYAGLAVVAAIFVVNTANVNFEVIGHEWIVLPGASNSPIGERKFTVVGRGYIETKPDRGARLLEIFEEAREDGVRRVAVGNQAWATHFFGPENLYVLVRMAGLDYGADGERLGPQDIFFYPDVGEPTSDTCSRAEREDFAFHLRRGDEQRLNWTAYPPYCPLEDSDYFVP